ncbi:hypothetical protein D1007_26701 [Hordeum vulgare]|nr:hypothetical protein D1007_26701 [Hordeum vulgare]
MEPLQQLFDLATEAGVLSKLPGRRKIRRCSFYADDMALFMNPKESDARMVKRVLDCFGAATGLRINSAKSSAFPIRCAGLDLSIVLAPLSIMVKTLPTTYLGLPLSVRNLTKSQLDPFLLKFASSLGAKAAGQDGESMVVGGVRLLHWRMPMVKEDLELGRGSGRYATFAANDVGQPTKLHGMVGKLCLQCDTEEKERTSVSHAPYDWEIWRERNMCIFQKECMSQSAFITKIKEEIILWNMAGAGIPFDPG